ncbi:MAG: hypothetical protein HXY52_00025 [Nitrospirae bacterium]|nr:hypothetical protein [Nitrospirota bacterium]
MISMILLIGCATIIGKSSPETLSIRSNPEQATVAITDERGTKVYEGKTPTTVTLEKKKGFFSGKKYNVKIYKDGCREQNIQVDTKLTGWYFGNLLFGGLIGILIVDPATGAMWTLDTNELDVSLETDATKTSQSESMKLEIALLQDVPISLRYKMIRIQ